jgi:hypothetical protein
MTTDTSCTVMNNIQMPLVNAGPAQDGWDGRVIAIDASALEDNIRKQGYEQSLTLLPFAGSETLAPGASGAIDLSQVPVAPGSTPHDLILAQSNNLFPVLEAPTADGSPIVLEASASAACANAFAFHRNICAFPTSTLAQDFAKLLGDTLKTARSTSEINDALNGFFRGEKDYTNITFDSYVAVSTWLRRYPFAFANFASEYAYSVYRDGGAGSDGKPNDEATLLGSVSFVKQAGDSIPSLGDSNGGYDIRFTDLSYNDTPLYYLDGQLVSSTTEESPSIALKCSYAQLGLVTAQADDSGRIVPVLLGTVKGGQVIGLAMEKPDAPDLLKRIQAFCNSDGGGLLLAIAMALVPLALLVALVRFLHRRFKQDEEENGGEEPTEDQYKLVLEGWEPELNSVDIGKLTGNDLGEKIDEYIENRGVNEVKVEIETDDGFVKIMENYESMSAMQGIFNDIDRLRWNLSDVKSSKGLDKWKLIEEAQNRIVELSKRVESFKKEHFNEIHWTAQKMFEQRETEFGEALEGLEVFTKEMNNERNKGDDREYVDD